MTEPARGVDRILEGLNDAQTLAVTHDAGPLLIIAGAGTGKTTVITRRIAYLIATRRARPSEILALTFTDKAAAEMEERVDTLIPYGYADVQIATFHAFGDRMVKENALELGLSPNRVLTRAEQVIFLRAHLFELPLQHYRPLGDPTRHLHAILSLISRLKDEDLTPEAYLAHAEEMLARAADDEARLEAAQHLELARTFAQSQRLMTQLGYLDFGDQIVETLRLLRSRPHVRRRYQERFKYILVDEFQDTNYAQNQVVQLLAARDRNLAVVADDDQCVPGGTPVETPTGPRPIETIRPGDAVLTAVGKGFLGTSEVTRVFQTKRWARLVTLETESGRKLTVTSNHKMFCYVPRVVTSREFTYVYLMERRDLGWRIGVTNDLSVRLCLERSADRIVGLRAFRSAREARYFEALWSLQYSIPTLPFKPRTSMMVVGEYLERLFHEIDTRKGAERLACDLGLDLAAHHFTLGAVHRGAQSRVKVILTICYRRHKPKGGGRLLRAAQILHAVSLATSSPETIERLRAVGAPLRKARKGWQVRMTGASLREMGIKAELLRDVTEGVLEARFAVGTANIQHRAALVMPAGNVLPGHSLPVVVGNHVRYERVVRVTQAFRTEETYDLEVARTHNFIAGGVVVHNSIYKWRGAAISNVLDFKEQYPDARDVILTENYRCPQEVLDAAYRLIQHNNPDRLEVKYGITKKLRSALLPVAGGRAPTHLAYDTVSSEADAVADLIAKEHAAGRPYRECAILVRANHDADPFLRALNMRGIPWTFSGNAGLYGRPEIRLLVAFLRSVAHPDDSVSLHYLASSHIYQVPIVDLTKCATYADRKHRWLFDVLRAVPDEVELSEEGRATIGRVVAELERYMELARETPTGELLSQFLVDSGLMMRYAKAPAELEQEVQNVSKFFARVKDAASVLRYDNVREFVNHLDALIDAGDDPAVVEAETDTPAVHVLTVHKAKGLEWPVVIVVNCVQNKFPSTRRSDPLDVPVGLIKDTLPTGDFHEQEERRLFYVAMTRAKEALYLTSAEDMGGRRKWKVSQFVLEALDLSREAARPFRASALVALQRHAAPPVAVGSDVTALGEDAPLTVSHRQVDDYETCPLKYHYIHILRVPLRQHHSVVYGSALHKAVEFYLRRRAAGNFTPLEDFLRAFDDAWRNEGFLTRAHEEQRKRAGTEALVRFYHEEEASGQKPGAVEQEFGFSLGPTRVRGRFDRVDETPDGVAIVDYKSSDVTEQRNADKRARESLQLKIYALAQQAMTGRLPVRVELRFLESGLVGTYRPKDADLAEATRSIRAAAAGIRARRFEPTPGYQICRYCPYNQVCPSTATRE
ncbi:MAG TPA: UvrD-helicase domain-containing protein [Candidatus Limnocylindrales bacterium]|nr:UvrD-helicase domain-containing protein [Candidatus Limnocylindrales bacterium]